MKIKTSVVVALLGCLLGGLAMTGCSPEAKTGDTSASTNTPSTNMPSTNTPAPAK